MRKFSRILHLETNFIKLIAKLLLIRFKGNWVLAQFLHTTPLSLPLEDLLINFFSLFMAGQKIIAMGESPEQV